MTVELDARHRRALGPAASAAWRRRLEALPEPAADVEVSVGQLCHERDLDAALAGIFARLPDRGRLVFVEHVGRPGALGRLQASWGAAAARFPGSCHTGRDVPAAIRRAGFEIIDLERFTMPTPVPVLRSWVSGTAVKRHR